MGDIEVRPSEMTADVYRTMADLIAYGVRGSITYLHRRGEMETQKIVDAKGYRITTQFGSAGHNAGNERTQWTRSDLIMRQAVVRLGTVAKSHFAEYLKFAQAYAQAISTQP